MTDSGRVLLADDEENFLMATKEILQDQGYQCDCAPDAVTATKMLESTEYDLLISDIKMPGNSNLEFIETLPQISAGLPVILITGYPSAETAMYSLELPVVAYMPKPFNYDKLLEKIQSAIKDFRVFRIANDMQENAKNWQEGLANITKTMDRKAQREYTFCKIDDFLGFSFKNITDTLIGLNDLVKVATGDNGEQEVCSLLDCPKLYLLQDVLSEVFATLEKTKGSFRSKELGQLSKKLNSLFELEVKIKDQLQEV